MANASVEKLKALGIRHGEKAVVGLTATLFVVFTALAVIKPTLEMRPEELSKSATDAESNLKKRQNEKDILAKLENDGLKEPNFEKVVANQLANALKPGDYRSRLDWVSPEPGAGLIRDQPELIAPTELYAFPGRGGILMYALDDKGERKILSPEEAKKRANANRSAPGMMPGMGGPGMGGPRRAGPPAKETAEAKKRREAEEEKRKAAFAGDVDKAKEKAKDQTEADPTVDGPWQEETKGKRWVVLTGVIDNAKLRKNYLIALKNEAIAYPNYRRIEVERQIRQEDGTWSEWAAIDQDKNYEVLDNLPELDTTEYVPENQRPPLLVDPLPFLKAGYWSGVHVAQLVPPEILETPKAPANTAPGGGRYPGAPGAMGGSFMGGDSASRPPTGGPGMMPGGRSGTPGMMPGMSGSGGRGGMIPGMMGSGGVKAGGGTAAGSAEEANFTKYDAPSVMLRSLDFTVDPNTTYRFRVRIVVVNPNYEHDDVNPGVDITSKELLGPWSEPSDDVMVPADITAYAMAPQEDPRRDDLVSFQIVRWDPVSGQTLLKNDVAAPGAFVGEFGSIPMPTSEGTGVKSANIDFNSRAIVLDTLGGRQKLPDIGVERNKFEVPALALLVEPDGSVVIRNQARDKTDDVRDDMETNYKLALEDSGKKRDKGGSRKPGARGKKKKKGGRR